MELTSDTNFASFIYGIVDFLNTLIPAIFGIVFLVVMWKVIDAWVIHGADQSKRAEGKQLLLIAVLVFVLMISTWGIIAMIRSSFFPQ